MFEIKRYHRCYLQNWDDFISKNQGHFMCSRGFIEYHGERFVDWSVLVWRSGELVGLMAAEVRDGIVYSHRGLTFGGIVYEAGLNSTAKLQVVDAVIDYFKEEGVQQLVVKMAPDIYVQGDSVTNYGLWRRGGVLERVDMTVFCQFGVESWSSRRKRGLRKSEKAGVEVSVSEDFACFWNDVLTKELEKRHGVLPVHSLEEIELLRDRFRRNIVLLCAFLKGKMVAGVVLFLTERVCHLQYISTSEMGRSIGALEAVVENLFRSNFMNERVLNFGTVNEHRGKYVNTGLLNWKEEFGGEVMLHREVSIRLHG